MAIATSEVAAKTICSLIDGSSSRPGRN